MKQGFLLFMVFTALSGCRNGGSASTDPQQNRYYRVYNEIYKEWGSIPPDSTQQKLGAYLNEFPENADAQMLAGNVASSLAEYDLAIKHYRAAITLQPKQAVYYAALGSVFNRQNKIDSAESYLLKAIALGDSSAYTAINASILYLKKNEREKCLAFADSAFSKDSSSPVICSALGFVFYQLGNKPKSHELMEKALLLGLKDTNSFNQVLAGKMKLEDYYRTNYLR